MAKITRQLTPPSFTKYGDYKPFLRVEFLYSCVYCGVYESEYGSEDNFQIDHYAPQKSFPMLECIYQNLLYSCAFCNGPSAKRAYWPTALQREKGKFVLNPCRHDIDEHIDRTSSKWSGLTAAGSWNVTRFYLDSETLADIRDCRPVQAVLDAKQSSESILRIVQQFSEHLTTEEIDDLLRLDRTIEAIVLSFRRRDSRRSSAEAVR